ncbi:MAG: flippase-like domain-containing protein [Clostridia bacterium]|nr:flippase-like domain-containing protein [Clostridia bacterium]
MDESDKERPTEKAAPVEASAKAQEAPTSESEKKRERNKRVRSVLLYLLFFLVNAIVIAVFLLQEDKTGDRALWENVKINLSDNLLFAIPALFGYVLVLLADVLVFNVLIYKLGGRNKSVLATKAAVYGRYYDKITPWSVGGEPFQIGYLIFGGLRAGESCAVTMSRHIVRFFTTAPIVIAILLIGRISTNAVVMAAAILSVIFGLIVPTLMLICAKRPVVGEKIGLFVIRVLTKVRIVKDPQKITDRLKENIRKFSLGVDHLTKNRWALPVIACAAIIELVVTNSLPYFVIRAFGYAEVNFWRTFVLCVYVTYASGVAPTPGGAGLAELSFYAVFATIVPDGYLFWAVLFWRIAVFYLPVFIGFLLHIYDSVRGVVRSVKQRR